MEICPDQRIGLLNGWLLVVIFSLVFGSFLLLCPKEVVTRLYERPHRNVSATIRRILGVVLALAWLLLTTMTPLQHAGVTLVIGLTLYVCGLTGFVLALFSYARTPADQPVASGLYRFSRHPQQVMVSLVFLGISVAIGSWIAVGLILVGVIAAHAKVLAEERACLDTYGDSYRDYMKRVPRYFLLF